MTCHCFTAAWGKNDTPWKSPQWQQSSRAKHRATEMDATATATATATVTVTVTVTVTLNGCLQRFVVGGAQR